MKNKIVLIIILGILPTFAQAVEYSCEVSRKLDVDREYSASQVSQGKVKIKKFYVFDSQFDVQLFADLTFVENDGRTGISFGKCQVTSP